MGVDKELNTAPFRVRHDLFGVMYTMFWSVDRVGILEDGEEGVVLERDRLGVCEFLFSSLRERVVRTYESEMVADDVEGEVGVA